MEAALSCSARLAPRLAAPEYDGGGCRERQRPPHDGQGQILVPAVKWMGHGRRGSAKR